MEGEENGPEGVKARDRVGVWEITSGRVLNIHDIVHSSCMSTELYRVNILLQVGG